jgi:archaemetzincin
MIQRLLGTTSIIAFCLLGLPLTASAETPAPDKVTNPDVTLCLVPLGKHDPKMLAAAERGVRHVFGFATLILPKRKLPQPAWYAPRERWRAEKLLDFLREEVRPGTSCTYIVGFTSRDISTTKGEHVDWGILGLGELGGVAAVVSSYQTHKKLKPPHNATRRVVKVVNHEIGHVMGLPHFKQAGCLMNDAEGTVQTVDDEHGALCQPTIDHIERVRKHAVPARTSVNWDYIENACVRDCS